MSDKIHTHTNSIRHIRLLLSTQPHRLNLRRGNRRSLCKKIMNAGLGSLLSLCISSISCSRILNLLFGVNKVKGGILRFSKKLLSQNGKQENLHGLHMRILERRLVLQKDMRRILEDGPSLCRHLP